MPNHPGLRRFPRATPHIVEAFIGEVLPVAMEVTFPPSVFTYDRDPKDAHYIDLAVAVGAEIVTSRDNALLHLMTATTPEPVEFRRRFPSIRILAPEVLLRQVLTPERR